MQAADLIGQLGDPLYLKKANALFCEFEEVGVNRQLGYDTPADLVERYPDFYWKSVSPHLNEAMRYLNVTTEGRQWIANLHSHLFCVEHSHTLMGPQRFAVTQDESGTQDRQPLGDIPNRRRTS